MQALLPARPVLFWSLLALAACAAPPDEPAEPMPPAQVEPDTSAPDGSAAEPDRAAALALAREEVRRSGLPGEVEFHDVWLRRQGDWAFLRAEIRRPGGAYIYDTDPAYCEGDAFVQLLLRRADDEWTLATGDRAGAPFCVSDAPDYGPYVRDYGAPAALFPPGADA